MSLHVKVAVSVAAFQPISSIDSSVMVKAHDHTSKCVGVQFLVVGRLFQLCEIALYLETCEQQPSQYWQLIYEGTRTQRVQNQNTLQTDTSRTNSRHDCSVIHIYGMVYLHC